jgi:hypothetical protein
MADLYGVAIGGGLTGNIDANKKNKGKKKDSTATNAKK